MVRGIGPPLVAWLVATGVVFVTCVVAGRSPLRVSTWDYSDPQLYVDIARHGYTLFRCAPGASEWCGNAGWFPAYAWLMGAVSAVLGVSVAGAGLALAWLCSLGTLVLLWLTFLGARLEFATLTALAYAAFAPGMVFGYAMYPLSLLALCTVAYLWLVAQERWLASGFVGYLLVLIYPVGLASLVAVAAYIAVAYRREPLQSRARRIVLAVGPGIAAVGLLLAQMQLSLGHWNAYFLVQRKYGHQVREPFASLVHALANLVATAFPLGHVTAFQTLLVTATLLAVTVTVARRRSRSRTEVLLVLWALATWLLPASTSHLAGHRGDAALLPVAALVALLPRRLAVTLTVGAAVVSVPIVVLYLRGSLS